MVQSGHIVIAITSSFHTSPIHRHSYFSYLCGLLHAMLWLDDVSSLSPPTPTTLYPELRIAPYASGLSVLPEQKHVAGMRIGLVTFSSDGWMAVALDQDRATLL